ncbi:MAG: DUF983 domain-containing protein [Pseudomonadota bacterium]
MAESPTKDRALYAPQPPFKTALAARCPRCGEGKLYQGLLKPAHRCSACGLDYSFEDVGDGPTVFVMLIVGFVIVGSAIYAEFALGVPLWVHFVLWPPALAVFGLWTLRVTKSLLIVLQYQNDARPGKLEGDTDG